MVESRVSGLRISFKRSRRMIAKVFMVVRKASALLRHPGADQEADFFGGLVAQGAAGEADEDVFERKLVHADRGDVRAAGFDAIDQARDDMRAVVGGDNQLAAAVVDNFLRETLGAQRNRDRRRVAIDFDFDSVGAVDELLEAYRSIERNNLAVIDD